jgi:DNA-directed RNA polymerase specialized sigma54-like protein
MAISQKLQARLSQKLILTPSLQQAIKLLPMTTLELAELLNQEMVENPMLEEVPTEEPSQEATQQQEAGKAQGQRKERRGVGRRRLRVLFRRIPRTRATGPGSLKRSRNYPRSRTRSRPRVLFQTI